MPIFVTEAYNACMLICDQSERVVVVICRQSEKTDTTTESLSRPPVLRRIEHAEGDVAKANTWLRTSKGRVLIGTSVVDLFRSLFTAAHDSSSCGSIPLIKGTSE